MDICREQRANDLHVVLFGNSYAKNQLDMFISYVATIHQPLPLQAIDVHLAAKLDSLVEKLCTILLCCKNL